MTLTTMTTTNTTTTTMTTRTKTSDSTMFTLLCTGSGLKLLLRQLLLEILVVAL